jgi:hypothetical protein
VVKLKEEKKVRLKEAEVVNERQYEMIVSKVQEINNTRMRS